jgi:hypothetical protein
MKEQPMHEDVKESCVDGENNYPLIVHRCSQPREKIVHRSIEWPLKAHHQGMGLIKCSKYWYKHVTDHPGQSHQQSLTPAILRKTKWCKLLGYRLLVHVFPRCGKRKTVGTQTERRDSQSFMLGKARVSAIAGYERVVLLPRGVEK